MITLDDCIGVSGLSEDEVMIIAEHENLSMIVAAELGSNLLGTPKGVFTLKGYIVDVLEKTTQSGDREKAKRIDRVLRQFVIAHPIPRVLR